MRDDYPRNFLLLSQIASGYRKIMFNVYNFNTTVLGKLKFIKFNDLQFKCTIMSQKVN